MKQRLVDVEVASPFDPIFPIWHAPSPEFSDGASKRPRKRTY
jgi:hypothetical protein